MVLVVVVAKVGTSDFFFFAVITVGVNVLRHFSGSDNGDKKN